MIKTAFKNLLQNRWVDFYGNLVCSIGNFFSGTAKLIELKCYVDPPWVVSLKLYSRYFGHMTKMADMIIYGKSPSKIFFSKTGGPISMKLGL